MSLNSSYDIWIEDIFRASEADAYICGKSCVEIQTSDIIYNFGAKPNLKAEMIYNYNSLINENNFILLENTRTY